MTQIGSCIFIFFVDVYIKIINKKGKVSNVTNVANVIGNIKIYISLWNNTILQKNMHQLLFDYHNAS